MKNPKLVGALFLLAALSILLIASTYIVYETDQVIITQFGKPKSGVVADPGIHFKVPFIDKVNRFEKRFLEWDGDRNELPTRDKRYIFVDTYARWRIADPLQFFQRVRDERSAQSRLDDILDGATRDAVASHDLVELIRTSNREFQEIDNSDAADADQSDNAVYQKIEVGRSGIATSILNEAAPKTLELGIELLDLRFKRIKYIDEVQRKIFERMITERKRIADQYRSEGQGEASKILGDKERELQKIQSEAFKEAEEIRGDADAEATRIYAAAYDRSNSTRDFYRFLKTMESYDQAITEKDLLILSTENDFFRFLKDIDGR